jgi:pantoate--beta-alanine ligase
LKIINSVAEMQAAALEIKRQGKTIAFVPTMGYLHQGHASLLRAGRKAADVLVLSIFVNPIQFGQNEDLDRYPRNMAGDCALAEQCGVDVVFAPEASGMYHLDSRPPSRSRIFPCRFAAPAGRAILTASARWSTSCLILSSRMWPSSAARIFNSWP